MNKRTRRALERSIAHWEENANAHFVDIVKIGSGSCPLCRLYSVFGTENRGNNDDCSNECPVMKATGKGSCLGTPYVAAAAARNEWADYGAVCESDEYAAKRKAFRKAAKREVRFLKSLREGK